MPCSLFVSAQGFLGRFLARWRQEKTIGRKKGSRSGLSDSKGCPEAAEGWLNCYRTQLGTVTHIPQSTEGQLTWDQPTLSPHISLSPWQVQGKGLLQSAHQNRGDCPTVPWHRGLAPAAWAVPAAVEPREGWEPRCCSAQHSPAAIPVLGTG